MIREFALSSSFFSFLLAVGGTLGELIGWFDKHQSFGLAGFDVVSLVVRTAQYTLLGVALIIWVLSLLRLLMRALRHYRSHVIDS
jgi:hypothetical protein